MMQILEEIHGASYIHLHVSAIGKRCPNERGNQ